MLTYCKIGSTECRTMKVNNLKLTLRGTNTNTCPSNNILSYLISQNSMLMFLWLKYLWELYLNIRQHQVYINTKNAPDEVDSIMDKEVFEQARQYSIDKSKFKFVSSFFFVIKSTVVIRCGLLAKLWAYSAAVSPLAGKVATSCIWACLLVAILTAVDLPFIIYSTFVIEAKYGFNKQTVAFFMADQGKLLALEEVMYLILSVIILTFVENSGRFFFLWLWVAIAALLVLFQTIYPLYIAPLFDKFTLLSGNDQLLLEDAIQDLASELRFPLEKIYVVKGSMRSAHSNAYLSGLFSAKSVVIYDTLLTGNNNDEILAILGHEFGHWRCNHLPKHIAVLLLRPFLVLAAFARILHCSPMYTAVGFPQNLKPALVGLFIVNEYIMVPCTTLLSFFQTWRIRCGEYEADRFSAKLGMAKNLKIALIKLYKANLAFPVYDPWYSVWYMDHPTLLQRLEALKSK